MGKMVGERFHPTDEELTSYYLSNKILGKDWLVQEAINEINICKFDPWELPQQSKIQSSDQVWYFFSPRDNKYLNSKRTNRTTRSGFWKATGVDRKIRAKMGNRDIIGAKKTLVFYKGRVPKGERTSWVMHEYHLTLIPDNQRTYVVCKIKDKSGEYKGVPSCNGNDPRHSLASDSNDFAAAIIPEVEAGQPSLETPESFFGLSDYELAVQLNEQEGISISELQFTNDFGGNPYPNTQQPTNLLTDGDHIFLHQSECEDLSFLEDFLVDTDNVYPEKSLHEHCNEYRQPKSLEGVYFNYSSDGDAETVSAVVLQTNGGSPGTDESCTSASVSKSANHPKNPNIVLQEHPRRIRLQRKTTQTATSKDKGKSSVEPVSAVGPHKNKKSSVQELEKEKKKGSFCFLKTIDASPEPNLPYIYLINVIIGLILSVVIVREIMCVH